MGLSQGLGRCLCIYRCKTCGQVGYQRSRGPFGATTDSGTGLRPTRTWCTSSASNPRSRKRSKSETKPTAWSSSKERRNPDPRPPNPPDRLLVMAIGDPGLIPDLLPPSPRPEPRPRHPSATTTTTNPRTRLRLAHRCHSHQPAPTMTYLPRPRPALSRVMPSQ